MTNYDLFMSSQVKDRKVFEEWLKRLRHHRLYRQHEIAYGTNESPRLTDLKSPSEDIPLPTLTSESQQLCPFVRSLEMIGLD